MAFSIDFGNALAPQYAAVPGNAVSLGGGEVAYNLVAEGVTHVMTDEVYRAFALCRGFRTLPEHAEAIVRRLPALADKQHAVVGVLESLASRGLLRSDAQLRDRIAHGEPRTLAPLRAVFIRACDRPEQLAALLQTLATYERRFDAGRRYVVLDDSRDPAAQARHRELVAAFAQSSGAMAVLFDEPRWQRLVERLRSALPHCAGAIDFALARQDAAGPRRGPGKGFNLATLLGAGARYVMLDDDFRFEFRRAPDAVDGVEPGDEQGPPLWLFDDASTALERGSAFDGDPIEAHLRWCGQRLGALVAPGGGMELATSGMAGYELGRLPLAADTRVLATDNGHRGSSRHGGSLFVFRLRGGARDAMWRDRAAFERNLDAPNVWHAPLRAQLVGHVNLTPFMLDGSALLPPTLPTGVGEDQLFGELARFLHPDALVLAANLTIAHVQEGSRPRRAMLGEVYTPALRDLLGDLARGTHDFIKTRDPAQRMARYATVLRDLAEAPETKRLEVLAGFIANTRGAHVRSLQDAMAASTGAPAYWIETLRETIMVTGRRLTTYTTPRLEGWPDALDEASCARRLAEELGGFAELLEHWPEIWRYAAAQGDKLLDA